MLAPCVSCSRHITAGGVACPFCGARAPSPASRASAALPRSRASFLAGGAVFVALGGAACAAAYGGPPPDHARPDAGVASAAVAREPLVVSPIGAEITVGARPPDFTARAHDGRRIRLSELEGKVVVLYFYPKDETPGCTAEACAFRDAWAEIEKSGAVLVGISTDSDASHRAFAAHHRLPFLLVSDPDGELARAYGVPVRLSFTSRQSFVVGRDGKVRKIYRSVDVKVHAAEILADVRAP